MTTSALIAAAATIRADSAARQPSIGRLRLAGIGWATVELERAAFDPAIACGTWSPAPRDDLLGARVWRCPDSGIDMLLLEPDTEGRLAAALARFGEGIAAIYLAGGHAPSSLSGLGAPADGPLGIERLLLGGPTSGPHVLVLEPARPAEPPADPT